MDKRYSQLELFSEGREPEAVKEGSRASAFFFQVNRFEKVIFFLIGFIVTGAGFFCLGVEHGKRLTAQRPTPDFNLALAQKRSAVKIVVTPRAPAAPQAIPPSSRRIEPPSPVAAPPQMAGNVRQGAGIPAGSFTIQIGTYQMSDAAQREKDKLARKGFSPVVVKKGAYNIVCVGTFADKETARSLLSKLRQNYRDCYIRRL